MINELNYTETQTFMVGATLDPSRPARGMRLGRRGRRAGRSPRMVRGGRFGEEYFFSGGYSGSSNKRPMLNWSPGGGSADEDLLGDLPELREKCRDLYRNNPLAAGAIDTEVDNVVGTGFTPQSRIERELLGWSEDKASDFQSRAEAGFRKWRPKADAGDVMNFDELCRLAWRQVLDNGEVFLLRRFIKYKNRPYGLAFEPIEADRVATPLKKISDKSIRSGIEFSADGVPVAYWINKKHPGDTTIGAYTKSNQWLRVPRYDAAGRPNVIHLFEKKRPGQSRGVPYLSPVVDAIKQLCDYMEAEVVAAHVNACFATAIKSKNPWEFSTDRVDSDNPTDGREQIESFEPGMNYYLDDDEEVQVIDPTRPNSDATGFVEMFCRLIGAALGLPYELLLKNFSKTNYSSARAALLEARRKFKRCQKWLVSAFAQVAWGLLIEEMVVKGELPSVRTLAEFGRYRYELTRSHWLTPRWGWVDPTKEVEAMVYAIEHNVDTAANVWGENGGDWQEGYAQLAREKKERERRGIEPKETPRQPKQKEDKDEAA